MCCFVVLIITNQPSFAVLTVKVMKTNCKIVLYTLQLLVAVMAILSALLAVSNLLNKYYTLWSCDLIADSLTAGQIVGIVIGVVVFVGLIATIIILCICCLIPTCPCYYRNYPTTRTVAVAQRTPPTVTTATNTKTTNYQGPPAYDVDTGYQPYPPPTATTGKY